MIREFEPLIRYWDIIKDGSVEFKMSQENELIDVRVSPDTLVLDLKDPKVVGMLWPFIRGWIKPRMRTVDHIHDSGSVIVGLFSSLRAKKAEVSSYLSKVQEIADLLAENKKCVILMENGKQLVKMGYGAKSMRMRLLNVSNVEVHDISRLLKLIDEIELLKNQDDTD